MHIILLLILLCNTLRYSNAFTKCCQENNILVNGSCWDGSNVTSLSCEVRKLMGPNQDPPRILEIDDDDSLLITDEEEVGYYKVDSDKYCMTKEEENGTDVALVCFEKDEALLNDPVLVVFYYLKSACSFISVAFTLAVFVVYVFTPGLQDIEGICIINFVASLSAAFLVILLGPLLNLIDPYPCDTISFIFFTGTLATINWMNVLSFHLWRITIRPIFETHMKWTVLYCCYGYGIPILLVTTAVIVHHTQTTDLTTGESQCLIEMGNLLIFVYFYGPIILMIFLSIVLQIWVAKKVWIDIDRRDKSQSVVRLRKKSLMYGHLVLVMGTAYILDTISYATMTLDDYLDYFWHLSDCRTLLIGGVIFFIFVVLRNKVLKALSKKGLFCLKFPKKWEKLIDKESEHIETEEAMLTRDSTGL